MHWRWTIEVRKIAVLLPSLQMGGAEKLVLEEISHLNENPLFYFELHVVHDRGPLHEEFLRNGIRVIVWDAPHKTLGTIVSYTKIILYLRRHKFHIVHSHLLDHLGPWVGRLARTKVIATVHNDVEYNFFTKATLRQSDVVIACGSSVSRNIGHFVTASKVATINNAVLLPCISETSRDEFARNYRIPGVTPDTKTVLSIGRLTTQKGYDILIKAFVEVVRRVPNAVLLIAGDGPDRNKLSALISDSSLQANVYLLGLVMQISPVLQCCDVYVNSSRWEGLPLSVLEAMAHKKPIVATDVGGNSEVIRHEATGLLVPSEQPMDLAASIVRLLCSPKLMVTMGHNAFELYNNHYSIDSHCSLLADEYRRV